MSFSLSSEHSEFRFNNSGWYEVLRLALEHGWEPAGTVLERGQNEWFAPICDWQGGYDTNDYQKVTADDARALADAVEKSVKSPAMEPGWADYMRKFVDFARKSGGFRLS